MGESLTWDLRGLVPVVVQDRLTGEVRMLAYANEEALAQTRATGLATFYSRSREALWVKGETSGNVIRVRRVLVDCDEDALVYESEPTGPSCHTGEASCFYRAIEDLAEQTPDAREAKSATFEPVRQTALARLEAVLDARKEATAAKSYTKSLYEGGAAKIGEKLREEADELARAVADEPDERVVSEAADLVFHALVALRFRGVSFRDVLLALDARAGTGGHVEKASRGPRTSMTE